MKFHYLEYIPPDEFEEQLMKQQPALS